MIAVNDMVTHVSATGDVRLACNTYTTTPMQNNTTPNIMRRRYFHDPMGSTQAGSSGALVS
jgi:hypothetical protein